MWSPLKCLPKKLLIPLSCLYSGEYDCKVTFFLLPSYESYRKYGQSFVYFSSILWSFLYCLSV